MIASLSQETGLQNSTSIAKTVVAVHELTHAYADGREALRGITFQVSEHERVGLIGPNGAGKTTLFLRLCGVLSGKIGHASVGGLDPADPGHQRRLPEIVGVLFQNPDDQLFCATVLEDAAFGPLNLGATPKEAVARAEAALTRVGLESAGGRVPHKLSGGEKRRAALAGVLAMNPSILLLDEPSMFLDARGRRGLIELLGSLERTMIIAAHDLDFIRRTCSRVLILDEGKIVVDGATEIVLGNTELLEKHGL